MGRPLLDSLFSSTPAAAVRHALSEDPLSSDTYAFLLEHVEALAADDLIRVLAARLDDDIEGRPSAFVTRLASLLTDQDVQQFHVLLDVLEKADAIDPDAWWELTLKLRSRLVPWRWYRFVYKVRGGRIFDALNVAPSLRKHFVESEEANHPEPVVVPLLEAHRNDLAAKRYVLEKLPLVFALRVHGAAPHLFGERDVVAVAEREIPDERASPWPLPLPHWLAGHALARIRGGASDEEALHLLRWLEQEASVDRDELWSLALERFARSPTDRRWYPVLGRGLRTPAAWKTRGRELIWFCVSKNLGLPPVILIEALRPENAEDPQHAAARETAILRAAHAGLAHALVDGARAAIDAKDWPRASRLVGALLFLDPGSFISGYIHKISSLPDVPPPLIEQLELARSLFRKSSGRAATREAFHEAFLELQGGGR